MCYLIAKHIDHIGCVALKTTHGPQLSYLKSELTAIIGYEKIQLVTLSRPSAYAEYEPYSFVDTEEDFRQAVIEMYADLSGL